MICLTLIIIPLIFYSVLIWDRDWRIKLDTIFSELRIIGDSSLEIYEEWLEIKELQLENKSAKDNETYFVFSREGKADFFQKELDTAFSEGIVVFVGLNPNNNKEEIFVFKRFGDELRGLSVDGLTWINLFVPNPQFDVSIRDKSGAFVLSTAKHFDHSQEVIFHLPLPDLSFKQAFALRNKHLSLRVPLPNALFDFQIEISREQIKQLEGGNVFKRLGEFMILLIVIGGIGAWRLIHRMARPYDQLEHVMDAVEVKDYNRRYQHDRFGFEINTLGMKFNEMIEVLLRNIEEAKTERVKAELLLKELQIGQAVQKELLPKEIPQFSGLRIGHGFVPAKEVGGDFYDLFVKDKNQLMLAIADASDKGISACLYSLIARSLLRGFTQKEQTLSDAILQTNNLFYRDVQTTNNFVTAWVGYYQVEEQMLTYTSAGHYPALLVHPNGQIEELTTAGIALGVSILQEVQMRSIQLTLGSILLLYTDGVVEAHNEKGELFGKSRLFDFVISHRTLEPQQLIDQLIAEVGQFAKQIAQHDDLTVLCLRNS